MNNVRSLFLLFGLLLLAQATAGAQITVYRDSSGFDDRYGRLRDIDFEDLYSVTLDRVTIRTPWGLNAMAFPDSSDSSREDVFLWIGQGTTLDFPTRTRQVALDGYATPFMAEVTGYDDSVFQVSYEDFPVRLGHPAGIRRIRLMGFDEYGDPDVNWTGGLQKILSFGPEGDTISFTLFDELQGDHYYLLGMELDARDFSGDTILLEPVDVHGVTITEPTIAFGGTFLSEFEARVDPDNPIGNLSVELAADATLEFPEGTEGVLMVLEGVHPADSFLIEVSDYAGSIDTVLDTGYGRQYDTTWVEDQRATFAHLGFGSESGIRMIRLLGANNYGSILLAALHLAEIPQNEIASMGRVIADLDTSGFLRRQQSDLLQGELQEAIDRVKSGDREGAVERLLAFREDVRGFAGEEILVAEESRYFLNDAAYVITRLGGTASAGNGDRATTPAAACIGSVVSLPDGMRVTFSIADGVLPAVRVHDLRGVMITTLKPEAAGDRMATTMWDLRDASGDRVSSGVYLITVDAPGGRAAAAVIVEH